MTVVLAADGVEKRFGATRALAGVDFQALAGEVHALVGENGAGKSTLIRLFAGVHRPDAGRIVLEGRACAFGTPRDAIQAGIVTIPQELRLVPALSVAENIVLGDWPVGRAGLAVDRRAVSREATEALALVGVDLPLDVAAGRLGFAERQLIAIAKALRRQARVLILDEPTAALQRPEVERLLAVLDRLKARGAAIVYISHRLQEVIDVADRCTVMRDGRVVDTALRGGFDLPRLIESMTGRRLGAVAQGSAAFGAVLLDDPVATLRQGEVVGLAGLLGSGARRTVRRLFERPLARGFARGPAAAIAAGVGFVPGERALGLVMNRSVRENILLPSLDRVGRTWWIAPKAGDAAVRRLVDLLDIRPRDPDAPVSTLSGGNQQKVVFAKWLMREVRVLLLDEPTQGIDMAARAQLHRAVRDFAARGGGVAVASSDIDELLQLCDTLVIMRDGAVAERIARREGFREQAVREAIGG